MVFQILSLSLKQGEGDYLKSQYVSLWQLCLWHWSHGQSAMARVVQLILLPAKELISQGIVEVR